MKIGVVGGGMMGLVAAERLSMSGHHIVLYDQGSQLGGLCTWHDYGKCVWDKFYHVILPSDQLLINLVRDIDLGSELHWRPSRTGFYQNGRHYSVSTNVEFLKFPLLSPLQKARMVWTFLYGSSLKDWKSLENLTTEKWLIRHSGRKTYETFWRPMLMAKLGEHYSKVSAVFIWAYIKRLFTARDPAVGKENLGHVAGGYRTVVEAIETRIRRNGEVRLNHMVSGVRAGSDDGLLVTAEGQDEQFDRVIFTGPAHLVKKVVSDDIVQVEESSERIRYLGVICLVMLTRKQLTPYYVLNIADADMPFTGVIGMSTVVPITETGDCFLTYFPRYLDFEDPMFLMEDEDLVAEFVPAAKRLFPELTEYDIVSCHINRARVVQPLQVLDYSRLVPQVTTRHPGLFVLNTGQISNNTVHNNEVVRIVTDFLHRHARAFDSDSRMYRDRAQGV